MVQKSLADLQKDKYIEEGHQESIPSDKEDCKTLLQKGTSIGEGHMVLPLLDGKEVCKTCLIGEEKIRYFSNRIRNKSVMESSIIDQLADLSLGSEHPKAPPNKPRPTFRRKNPIRAGGVLLYKKEDTVKFLMIYDPAKQTYEDFGGKSKSGDETYQMMCVREAEEESNGVLKKEELLPLMINSIYIRRCKYILFLIETTNDYNSEQFGEYEIRVSKEDPKKSHHRIVKWVDIHEVVKQNLHPRLRSKAFFEAILKL